MASVEELNLEGASITLLAVCDGDQANIGLECMKSAFASLTSLSSDVAQRIADAAPSMFAHSCAAMVIAERTAYAAMTGEARIYRQRAHRLEAISPGMHATALSDLLLVASHGLRAEGEDFSRMGSAPTTQATLGTSAFRNDTLDHVLDHALAASNEEDVAVAAMCEGS